MEQKVKEGELNEKTYLSRGMNFNLIVLIVNKKIRM